MVKLSAMQMSAGQRATQDGFVKRVTRLFAAKYSLSDDHTLTTFVEGRRAMGITFGFETDLQISDFIEACLLTRDAILSDAAFHATMQRPLLRTETKAQWMLQQFVWPHPAWQSCLEKSDS